METNKKDQMKILELKNTVSEIKVLLNGLRADQTLQEKKIGELKSRSIELSKVNYKEKIKKMAKK